MRSAQSFFKLLVKVLSAKIVLISSLGLISTPVFATLQSKCTPQDNSCEFYLCKESKFSCGEQGYWKDFGLPYCIDFLVNESKYSLAAQSWLREVRYCLQERADIISEASVSCEQVRSRSLHSHIDCYAQTGFCNLVYQDQIAILWKLKTALGQRDTWREMLALLKTCSKNQLQSF